MPKRKKNKPKLPPVIYYYTGNKKHKHQENYFVGTLDPGREYFGFRIEEVTKKGKFVKLHTFRVTDVWYNEDGDKDDYVVYYNLVQLLNKYKENFLKCDFICVERQLKQNQPCVRIMQHIITYFIVIVDGTDIVLCDMDPKFKYRYLGAPSDVKGKKLKNVWGPMKAMKICRKNKDKKSIKYINKHSKINDLTDLILMSRALIKYTNE